MKASTAGGADDARLAFWRLFEPVVRLRAMGVHHKFDDDALMGAVHRVLRFPQAQLAERSAAAAERAAVEGGDAGDAHVSAMEVRAAYAASRVVRAAGEPRAERPRLLCHAGARGVPRRRARARPARRAPRPTSTSTAPRARSTSTSDSCRGLEYGPMLNHRGRASRRVVCRRLRAAPPWRRLGGRGGRAGGVVGGGGLGDAPLARCCASCCARAASTATARRPPSASRPR